MRFALFLPVVVLCAGAALLLDSIAPRHRYNWHPASLPAPLNEGASVVLAFKADQAISYDIRLDIRADVGCLPGETAAHRCVDPGKAFEAEWEARLEGQHIASGTSRDVFGDSSGDGRTETPIGSFAAESGKDYTVVVRFTKPLTAFSGVDPRITISGDRQAFKTWNFKVSGAQDEACLVLLVGFVWFFVVRIRSAQAGVLLKTRLSDLSRPGALAAPASSPRPPGPR